MRSQPWFRVFASLLALWFPLIAGEPGFLHPCPMHGAGAAVAASFAGHPASHASHAAVRHGAEHATTQHSAPSHGHHQCTCINGCCTSLSATTPPAPETVEIAVVDVASASATANAPTLARPEPEFARPYTTGPPRT